MIPSFLLSIKLLTVFSLNSVVLKIVRWIQKNTLSDYKDSDPANEPRDDGLKTIKALLRKQAVVKKQQENSE